MQHRQPLYNPTHLGRLLETAIIKPQHISGNLGDTHGDHAKWNKHTSDHDTGTIFGDFGRYYSIDALDFAMIEV